MFGLTSLRYAKTNWGKFNLMWRVGTNVLILQTQGEVSEWLKEHAWKVCIGQKPIAGSNPALSAKPKSPEFGAFFVSGSLSVAQAKRYEKRTGRRRSRAFGFEATPSGITSERSERVILVLS